jgi:hypothetical protein
LTEGKSLNTEMQKIKAKVATAHDKWRKSIKEGEKLVQAHDRATREGKPYATMIKVSLERKF